MEKFIHIKEGIKKMITEILQIINGIMFIVNVYLTIRLFREMKKQNDNP